MNTIPNEGVLRQHVQEATNWVREQLRRADIGSNFTLGISIQGPIQTGEAKLTYRLDCSTNYNSAVEGNSLAAVTWELLRRMGWKKENQGLQLEWNGAAAPTPAAEGLGDAPAGRSLDETE